VSTNTAPATTSQPAVRASSTETPDTVAPTAVAPQSESRLIETVVENPEYVARFSNRGAQLTSFTLTNYFQRNSKEPVELVRPRPSNSTDFPFTIESTDPEFSAAANGQLYLVTDRTDRGIRTLEYKLTTATGVTVVKRFVFDQRFRFQYDIQASPRAPQFRAMVGPGLRKLLPGEESDQFARTGHGLIQRDGSLDVVTREKAPKVRVWEGMPDFVGLEDNYFLGVMQPRVSGGAVMRSIETPGAKEGEKRREIYAGLNAASGRLSGRAFFGPKETDLLTAYGLDKALHLGVFGPIARILLWALKELYKVTHNYGWAIIILTIIIKALLYPLQHKSIVSMKKMQRVQPKMNVIREKYKKAKSDPEQRQKMNTEMMKLYQQEGINPASGCLPILLQLPILWAFYSLLSNAIELRGAEFALWIHDLSAKDPYYITPILMTITMFIQQWMTPTTADPMQRRIFLAMPFIFGWIFKEFPSGLVLYWLVQNILSIIQQAIMNRYWKDHPESLAEPPTKKGPK
jgi:YidC/Oxa1 family membrane protein insertase